jgi:TRAP transporter 4TM/12TM fusion protein
MAGIIKKLNVEQFSHDETEMPRSVLDKVIITVVAALLCVFHLYTAGFGALSALDQRLVHWMIMFTLIFLLYPSKSRLGRIVDYLLVLLCIISAVYLYIAWRSVSLAGTGTRSTFEIVLGVLTVAATLAATKRTCGWTLPIVACFFLLYLFAGRYLPSVGHRGYSMSRIITIIYFGSEGIFGTAIGTSATIIIIFVMFGSLLSACGGGKVFIDLAFALTGRYRGGAAKTAIVSSALMGTVSGSPIANVVTTGTFTIPLMKSSGYKAHVAGAVEAVASTGGQIMPPIMGAAAFIMSEYLAIPYAKVTWAAVIPAILYYISIFVIVDIEAIKSGIVGLPATDLPSVRKTLKDGWSLLSPLVLLLVLILSNYSVTYSVFYSIVLLLVVWIVRLKFNIKEFFRQLLLAFADTAKSASSVVAACACAGIVVGAIQLTGIGLKLCSYIEIIANSQLLIALVLCMVVALIMGMGLPTTVLYILLAAIVAPALINLGAEKLPAHMFVFYFGCMSSITPPVALAAFGAAPIAKAPYTKIGWTAFRFGLVAFIVPFMFMYSPALMFQGSWHDIIQAFISSVIGTIAFAYGIQGWLIVKACMIVRIGLFVSSLLLIKQGLTTDLIGFILAAVCILIQITAKRNIRLKGEL